MSRAKTPEMVATAPALQVFEHLNNKKLKLIMFTNKAFWDAMNLIHRGKALNNKS
jgi:hypothetical protein